MNLLIDELCKRRAYYNKMLALRELERNGIPGGYITLEHKQPKTFFYENNENGRRGITKDKARVDELTRAYYLGLEIKELRRMIETLDKTMQMMDPNSITPKEILANRFEGTNLDLKRIMMTPRQRNHVGVPSQNPYRPETLNVKTRCGLMVRSLSEQTWADLYDELGIPYQYEMKMTLDVTDMGQIPGAYHYDGRFYKDYYPDFTLFLGDDTIMIHEHLGLIDDEKYVSKLGERVVAYTESECITPDRLLLTYPNNVRDPERFMEVLKERVLPYV